MAEKNAPTSYSFEIIRDGLVKVGIHSSGYDEFVFVGENAKKVTKTESFIGDVAFWNGKILDLENSNPTIDSITSRSYITTAVNVDGNYLSFGGGEILATGSISYTKYERGDTPSYDGEAEIINVNDNIEILQYTIDGIPIITKYKGKTINRQYSTTEDPPIAGVRDGNTLTQSVSTSSHKVVDGQIWKRISITEIEYDNN